MSAEALTSIGLLGLGQMGGAIGRCCLRAGLHVTGYDPSPSASQALADAGGALAHSPAEVASRERLVLAFLPSVEACEQAIFGPQGVIHGERITCYVEGSTVGIAAMRSFHTRLAARGIGLADAPVSGGPRGAQEGRLLVMTAADDGVWAMLAPVLHAFARHSVRVGTQPGLAQACKLVNNAMGMAALATACEAAAVGVAAGMELGALIEAVNLGTGRSAATETKFPASIIPRSFDYGASMAIAAKDTQLFCAEAQALGLDVPLAQSVAQAWAQAAAQGGQRDFTELYLDYERHYHCAPRPQD